MSLVSNEALIGAAGQGGAYQIDQSLRFDGGAYLDAPFTDAYLESTWSFWAKRTKTSGEDTILWVDHSSGNHWGFRFGGGGDFTLFKTASGSDSSTTTDGKYRDPGAWYHVLVVSEYPENKNYIYINGVLQKQGSYQWNFISATQRIGYRSSSDSWNGYLAEFHHIYQQAKSPSDFGEFDDNGVWRPIEYTGTYGSRGYYLKFDPSASNGIGHDHSGNGNHFSASGFTTSGTGTDVMSDTPTKNYATMNPLRPSSYSSVSLSNGNLNASQNTTAYVSGTATIGVSSGKWYWEVDCNSVGHVTSIGITKDPTANGIINSGVYTYHYDGVKYFAGTATGYGASYTTGDLLGFALDMDAGTLIAYKNGTSQGTLQTGLSGTFFPYLTFYGTHNATFNFGQTTFQQTVPSGYKALNTKNLAAPTIKDGSKNFNPVTYAGNGGSNTITTGMNHSSGGGLLWIKNRSTTANHDVLDNVRGLAQLLELPSTAAEYTANVNLAATSTGYTLNTSSGQFNQSGYNYVAWNWLAGGSGSSNTNGDITSTVSANATAGFSIVTYSGDNGTSTVGHGLGVKPSMIWIKRRNGTSNWVVYSSTLGATKYLYLNSSAAEGTWAGFFGNTEPTSTVFTVSNDGATNGSGGTYVAYCFAEVEGYSKFGTYTGNGSSDGPFVYCGFKPAFVVTKDTTAHNWEITDNARDTYNVANKRLFPSTSGAESSSVDTFDFLSNGFKVRGTHGGNNVNGNTHIFMAFAEHPFGGSGATPTTAR